MQKFKDISNQRFGKLIALSPIRIDGRAAMSWECICDCGNKTIVAGNTLREGRSKSCGCSINQSHILEFKKKNPQASEREILKERLKAHTMWNGECLEWTATISNGYGTFVHEKRVINASRASWIAQYGNIPKGMLVLHHCDNRKCCNVDHLFLGTHKDNTEDMIKKKRDRWDTCRKFPVGTREKVGELREGGKMYREIMVELNLTMDQVKSLLQNYKRNKKRILL